MSVCESNNLRHTCQPGDMHPNMDEELYLSHLQIVPSPSGSSNKVPAFDRAAIHIEDFQGDPFPEQNFLVNGYCYCIIYKHKVKHCMLLLECHTSNSEPDPTPTMFSRSTSEMESSFSFSSPF